MTSSSPPVQFFQATSTIIPTLLIAMAFVSRWFDFQEINNFRKRTGAHERIAVVTALLLLGIVAFLICMAGELASLRSLWEEQRSTLNAFAASAAIITESYIIILGFLCYVQRQTHILVQPNLTSASKRFLAGVVDLLYIVLTCATIALIILFATLYL